MFYLDFLLPLWLHKEAAPRFSVDPDLLLFFLVSVIPRISSDPAVPMILSSSISAY